MFGFDVDALISFTIDSEIIPKLISCVNDVCVIFIDLDLHPIPTHDVRPIVVSILLPSQIFSAGVWSLPNAIVLQPPINVIGALLISIDRIKLSNRGLIIFNPVLSTIIADIDPTIIAVD